jgi:lipopolysaccharide transport system ATP-binding protein
LNPIVIHAENLGKQYEIGEYSSALRDVLGEFVKLPLRLFRQRGHGLRSKREKIWALRDVSLEICQGEVVGLIGRNGAGKSTLLKILARVTRPTTGHAELVGRIGSLLEVGTGFHPDLTGRENVFLSGAILGMRRAEITRKFDEIVAFAEIEQFIDTPLKRYSSGMQLRLAFAVAAHLEPEILLVDEVLAVGDLRFQNKCLGKVQEVARAGRTIVLVSHQLNQIRKLCQRVYWLDKASVRQSGPAHEVVSAYEMAMYSKDRTAGLDRASGAKARFLSWGIDECEGGNSNTLASWGPVTVSFVVELLEPITSGEHGVALFSADRRVMWASAIRDLDLEPGVHVLSHSFPSLPLRPGPYQWQVSLWDSDEMLDLWDCLPEMSIATEAHQHYRDEWNGVLNLRTGFSHQPSEEYRRP